MAGEFRSLGWEAKIDRAGNVVASLPGARPSPVVAITAHLDTVLAPGSAAEIRIAHDGRFLGPGVSDNGAGLAALLALARVWKSCPPVEKLSCAPLLIANVGEEGEGNLSGMRYLCKTLAPERIRSFLVLDGPATNHVTCEALASRRFEVVMTGPGGHSWSDHGTASPVHALSYAITHFTRTAPRSETRSSFNFGVVGAGTSINSIPQEAQAKVDLRSPDPSLMNALAVLLEEAMELGVRTENERAESGRVVFRLNEIGSRPGGSLATNAEILKVIDAVDNYLSIRAVRDCASTDANIPLSLGMEAVSIGAGGQGGGAHTTGEWFDPEGRELGLKRVLLAICLLCS